MNFIGTLWLYIYSLHIRFNTTCANREHAWKQNWKSLVFCNAHNTQAYTLRYIYKYIYTTYIFALRFRCPCPSGHKPTQETPIGYGLAWLLVYSSYRVVMHATKGNLNRIYNVLAIVANTIEIRAETLSSSGPSSTSIPL